MPLEGQHKNSCGNYLKTLCHVYGILLTVFIGYVAILIAQDCINYPPPLTVVIIVHFVYLS